MLKHNNSKGIALVSILMILAFTMVIFSTIIYRVTLNSKQAVTLMNFDKQNALADGDIQLALSTLQSRMTMDFITNRINNGAPFPPNTNTIKRIKDTDLIAYDTTRAGSFWEEFMNDANGEPFHTYPDDKSIAYFDLVSSNTATRVELHYANPDIPGRGGSYNDFTLRYYYKIIVSPKAGGYERGKTITAKTFFKSPYNDIQNLIQIKVGRSLSAYNLFAIHNTFPPDLVTPGWDSRTYRGRVYSTHRFFVAGQPRFDQKVEISARATSDADPGAGSHVYHKSGVAVPTLYMTDDSENSETVFDAEEQFMPTGLAEDAQRLTAYNGFTGPSTPLPASVPTVPRVKETTENCSMPDGTIQPVTTTVHVEGDATIVMSVNEDLSDPNYHKTCTYRIQDQNGNNWTPIVQPVYDMISPRMLIFVNGRLRIQGQLAYNSKTTISASADIIITENITYAAGPLNENPLPNTVLGLVSWNNDILISKDIVRTGQTYVNLEVWGVLMTPKGGVGSEGWQNNFNAYIVGGTSIYRGAVSHTGSIIRFYALPTFSSDNLRGWGFTTNYDADLESNKAPPIFPGSGDYSYKGDTNPKVVDKYTVN